MVRVQSFQLFREKEAVREAYNLFNEYADKIFGPENKEVDNPLKRIWKPAQT